MKKIVLAALASAAVVAGAGSAQASTITSPAGLTFTVGSACTLTGNVVNLGTYSTADTNASYAARQGSFDGTTVVNGTDTPSALATLTCPTGTAWSLAIQGSGANNSIDVFPSGSSTAAFSVFPISANVDGVAKTDFMNNLNQLNYTGNGKLQTIYGNYYAAKASGNTAWVATTPLVAGSYSGTATATLSF